MMPDRWQEVKEMIHRQYDVEYEEVEDMKNPIGETILGSMEVLEFEGPLGFMRLEYSSKPRHLGRKVHTSARIGGEGYEEVLLSKDEMTHFLKVFRLNDDDEWEEVKSNLFE